MRFGSNSSRNTRNSKTRRDDWPKLNFLKYQAIKAFDFLIPNYCVICEDEVSAVEASSVCKKCNPFIFTKDVNFFTSDECQGFNLFCKICDEPLSLNRSESDCCDVCKIFKPPFRNLRSLTSYELVTEELVKHYKYYSKLNIADLFANIIVNTIQCHSLVNDFEDYNWNLIIPVPSPKRNIKKRGFSHTHIITRKVSKQLEIPMAYLALERVDKSNISQALTPINKRRQIKAKFLKVKQKIVKNKNILLIDDVTTSGATIEACAAALVDNGANVVDALTIARSNNFTINRVKSLYLGSNAK